MLMSPFAGGGGDAMLTTSMELETADEDIEYHFNGTGSKKLSFNLSDFKAMLAFCTDVHTDVVVHLDEPGKCVRHRPRSRSRGFEQLRMHGSSSGRYR